MKLLKKILLIILALLIALPFVCAFTYVSALFLSVPEIGSDYEFASVYLDEEFGIDSRDYAVLHKSDSHGGFHGDGLYSIALDCSGNREEIQQITSTWKPLPLTENLRRVMYHFEEDGVIYAYDLAEEAGIPDVKNGCYYFRNRHSAARDAWDDDILGKYSFNFSLAIFDSDTNTLYFMAYDT